MRTGISGRKESLKVAASPSTQAPVSLTMRMNPWKNMLTPRVMRNSA